MLPIRPAYAYDLEPMVKPPVVVHAAPLADEHRRGVVIYRIIQASRNVAEQFPAASLFLVTEEGSRWRLPPPAI
jgi:hypothetical protein